MVEYFKREEVPGKEFFRCDRYSSTLSVDSCAAMWRSANTDNVERLYKCKSCPIGAVHAGETAASMSPFMGTTVCARCHRISMRLIGKMICVSCYNRQREWVIGKNAKGAKPVHMQRLDSRSIAFSAGEESRSLKLPLTTDTTELVVAVLRDSKKSVEFCFRGKPRHPLTQSRLF